MRYLMAMCFSMMWLTPCWAGQMGWVTQAKVSKLVVAANGGINVRLIPELEGCVSQSGYGPRYASIYPSHPGIDRLHSTLLAAYMADKTVAVYLSDDKCTIMEIELGGR